MKKIKRKGTKTLFEHFWFLNHSLRWFLVVPPNDIFARSGEGSRSFGWSHKFFASWLTPCISFALHFPTNNLHNVLSKFKWQWMGCVIWLHFPMKLGFLKDQWGNIKFVKDLKCLKVTHVNKVLNPLVIYSVAMVLKCWQCI